MKIEVSPPLAIQCGDSWQTLLIYFAHFSVLKKFSKVCNDSNLTSTQSLRNQSAIDLSMSGMSCHRKVRCLNGQHTANDRCIRKSTSRQVLNSNRRSLETKRKQISLTENTTRSKSYVRLQPYMSE